MPRLLALEWDSSAARVAVAQSRGKTLELVQTASIDLTACRHQPAEQWGAAIAAGLARAGIAGGETLVAVGRGCIELRFLNVPPVPAEELPDLVRFQAARHFSQLQEGSQIDFVPLRRENQPPNMVLAAAVTGEQLQFVQQLCRTAGLVPQQLALRPFAVSPLLPAELLRDSGVLLIDLLAEEADLTVMLAGQAVFPRTVRLGTQLPTSEAAASLLLEVRRTLAAARNQLPEHAVSKVVLFGSRNEWASHVALLEKELGLTVSCVDPFDSVTLADHFRGERTGRYAPLLGMLLHAARQERQEIDFLAPRQRPIPPDRSRMWLLAAVAAGCLILALGVLIAWQLGDLESEILATQEKTKQLEATLKKSRPTLEHARVLDEFAAVQLPWLSEFNTLAERLPAADRMIVRSLKGVASNSGGRLIVLGSAATNDDIAALEAKVRDERHRVTRDDSSQEPTDKAYPWQFKETITIAPPPATGSGS